MAYIRLPANWYEVPPARVTALCVDHHHTVDADVRTIALGYVKRIGQQQPVRTASVQAALRHFDADLNKSDYTTKIGQTHDASGLFMYLVAGTGFEPVTFGL